MAKSEGEGLFIFVTDALKTTGYVIYYVVKSLLLWVLPTQYKSIEDDIILITGGGRGLGRQMALELCKYRPKHVILWGRHVDTLSRTSKEVMSRGVKCTYMVCDVSDRKQIYQQAERVKETIGDVSILVNNAGIVYGHPILESRDEDIEKTFQVNTLAHFWTVKAFLPSMVRNNHGHLVAMDSMLGLMGLNGAGDYSTSKYATTGMAEALLYELRHEMNAPDVKITIAYPYQVDNDMFAGCKPRFPKLFPPIPEQYVAVKTVHAILTNQTQVVIPRMFYFMAWVKSWLPVQALWSLFTFLGVDRAMETFEGGAQRMDNQRNG